MQLNEHDLKWAVKRLPKAVREMMVVHGGKLFIAGGFIRSIIANEPVNDIDVFAPEKEYARAVATTLADGGRVWESEYAFSCSAMKPMTQFIHRWTYADAPSLIASFDFSIACAAIWHEGEKWHSLCHDQFYQDLAAKRLVYLDPVRNEDAGGSLLRVLKFYQRGYRIPLDSLAAVIGRLDRGVDRERIGGEPAGYVKIVLGLLREVDPNTPMEGFPH